MRLITVFLLFFISFNVFAGTVHGGYSTIKRLGLTTNNLRTVVLDVPHVNPAGCSKPNFYMLVKDKSTAFESAEKFLLAAKASNQKVGFNIFDNECHGGLYPIIMNLYIE